MNGRSRDSKCADGGGASTGVPIFAKAREQVLLLQSHTFALINVTNKKILFIYKVLRKVYLFGIPSKILGRYRLFRFFLSVFVSPLPSCYGYYGYYGYCGYYPLPYLWRLPCVEQVTSRPELFLRSGYF